MAGESSQLSMKNCGQPWPNRWRMRQNQNQWPSIIMNKWSIITSAVKMTCNVVVVVIGIRYSHLINERLISKLIIGILLIVYPEYHESNANLCISWYGIIVGRYDGLNGYSAIIFKRWIYGDICGYDDLLAQVRILANLFKNVFDIAYPMK